MDAVKARGVEKKKAKGLEGIFPDKEERTGRERKKERGGKGKERKKRERKRSARMRRKRTEKKRSGARNRIRQTQKGLPKERERMGKCTDTTTWETPQTLPHSVTVIGYGKERSPETQS